MKEALVTIIIIIILVGGFVNKSAYKAYEAEKMDSLTREKMKEYEQALDSLKCNVESLEKEL